VITRHLDAIDDLCGRLDKHADLTATAAALRTTLEATRRATTWLAEHATDPLSMLSGATPYLRLLSTLTGGFLLAESALIARDQESEVGAATVAERVTSARFFCEQLMPAVDGLVGAVTGDPALLMTAI
jgi:hypothetical protein